MASAHENFMAGARIAKAEADRCLREAAEATDNMTGFKRLAEYDELMERVDWYLTRAAWYAPKEQRKEAA